MSAFTPKLFTILKEGYSRKQFTKDLTAGLIVGIVALPLAIAFAIASGVSPEQGLYTAIVAGFIISFLGGSRVQIGGPTGAFIVIVYGIVQEYGVEGLTIATLMAGVLIMAMGFARFGSVIKFIPYPLIVGFTSGIAGLRSGDTAFIAGSGGPSFLAPLAVIPGQKLALLVDNFSTTDDGFTLDFSASTASFATPASPSLTVTNFESVNDSAIRVETSYSIFCSSIASDGSDFSITGPTAITITEATVLNCDTATLTSTIYLYYTGHLIDGGTYTLTPKTGTDGNGLLTLCVEVEQTGTSFIARDTVIFTSVDLTVEPRIQLSPNPTYDNLIIKTDASFSSACQVEMYDVFGKRVYHEVNQLVGGQIEIQLDNLTSGIYFFRLSDDGFIATRRFTVLK